MLKKLRKGALTIEFIVVVSILVLIVGLGTSWVVAQYNNAEDNANSVAEVIIKDANGLVGGGENGGQGGSESTPEPTEMINFSVRWAPDYANEEFHLYQEFTCPKGMTWAEFVNSEYNTASDWVSIEPNYSSILGDGDTVLVNWTTPVALASETIQANVCYE